MTNIQQLIKELNTLYPDYRFTKSNITYQAEATINIRCKEGVEELAYYGGRDYGYYATGKDLDNIAEHIKSVLPEYKIISFIDGKRKGHFEIHN